MNEIAVKLFSDWVKKQENEYVESDRTAQSSPQWFGVVREYAANIKEHDMYSIRKSIEEGRKQK